MSIVLWHIEISHYNEKVRFALAYKGIEHERRTPLPGLHGLTAARLTRGRHRHLPILRLEGRTIADSTAIIAALEEYRPDPPLYPADPAERARALELEDFFDEEVGPSVRAFNFACLFEIDAEAGPVVAPNAPRRAQRFLTRIAPVAKPIIRVDYDARDADRQRAQIVAGMDRLEAEIGPGGYLVGDRFTVADLAGASLFTPLLDPPGREHMPSPLPATIIELREELTARPGGQWVHEIFKKHR
jgi:glutathione S-transferase